jgi:hypothetical protein
VTVHVADRVRLNAAAVDHYRSLPLTVGTEGVVVHVADCLGECTCLVEVQHPFSRLLLAESELTIIDERNVA